MVNFKEKYNFPRFQEGGGGGLGGVSSFFQGMGSICYSYGNL